METFTIIATAFGALNALITFLIFIVKPFREWIFGIKKRKEIKDQEELSQRESLKCLIRSDITRFYYYKKKEKQLYQHEYENVSMLYDRYKALGGNSFIDKVWSEMQEWQIIE